MILDYLSGCIVLSLFDNRLRLVLRDILADVGYRGPHNKFYFGVNRYRFDIEWQIRRGVVLCPNCGVEVLERDLRRTDERMGSFGAVAVTYCTRCGGA
jgi:hypothetical protein